MTIHQHMYNVQDIVQTNSKWFISFRSFNVINVFVIPSLVKNFCIKRQTYTKLHGWWLDTLRAALLFYEYKSQCTSWTLNFERRALNLQEVHTWSDNQLITISVPTQGSKALPTKVVRELVDGHLVMVNRILSFIMIKTLRQLYTSLN